MPKPKGKRNKTQDEYDQILEDFTNYVRTTTLPIIDRFCSDRMIDPSIIDREQFSKIKTICMAKKRASLEENCLMGVYNPAMAIFSLKQMGWSDKIETKNAHEVNTIQLVTITPEEYRRMREREENGR